MSGVSKKLMGTTAAGGGFTAIEDVFSTYLYTGNGSTQTITNGIDLAGEGGLVWFKRRDTTGNNRVYDTERGMTAATGGAPYLYTNDTAGNLGTGFAGSVVATSTGFDIAQGAIGDISDSGGTYASWTFRKAPRFFDLVTYTGTGSARTIDHNLGTTVGSIIIKRTDTTSNWAVYHRGNTAAPETDFLSLNLTNATADDATYWNDTAPTDSVFTVGTNAAVNASGGTYVAYLFAHDPLGPSEDGSDGLIACGSYTGNGSTDGPEVDLGWEPQWVMIKRTTDTSSWVMVDVMRGMPVGGDDANLYADGSFAEGVVPTFIHPTATGFKLDGTAFYANSSGDTFIYIAIRRGPMRAPESGTEVFFPYAQEGTGSFSVGFPTDLSIMAKRAGNGLNSTVGDRLRGSVPFLSTSLTSAEDVGIDWQFDLQDDFQSTWTAGTVNWNFRRAPNFFDVVAYTPSFPTPVKHNLGVPYELKIDKVRDQVSNWNVVWDDGVTQLEGELNNTATLNSQTRVTNNSTEFVSSFNGAPCVSYLFATLAGVSKVGSYTGNGTSQTIDCGFTTGARFILIKRTDAAGDWYVWDTARGIVTGNDPFLELNTTDAEVTSDDSIDPDSSGFIVNQTATTNINVSSASYIFYSVS